MKHSHEEIEQSLLAMLLNEGKPTDNTVKVLDRVKQNDFYIYVNGVVYKYILIACQSNRPFDLINIDSMIKQNSTDYEDIGGFGFLAELADCHFYNHGVDESVRKLKSATKARLFTSALNDATAKMYGDGEADENIKQCLSSLSNLDLEQEENLFKNPSDLMNSFVNRFEKRILSDNTLAGFSFGFEQLDNLTCGAEAGDLIGLCGKPSSGKTALMLNMALNALRSSQSVLIFSAEMGEAPVIDRFISSCGRVDLKSIRTGRFRVDTEDEDQARIGKAINELKSAPLTLVDKGALHISDIEMMLKTHCFKHGSPDWVFIDYWQIIKGDGFNQVNAQENVSTRIKALAKEHGTRVVLGAQLRKDAEGFPKAAHIKGSARLEEDSDILIFIHSDNEDYKPIAGQMSQVVAAKVRNGEIGIVPVMPRMNIQTFDPVDGEYVAPIKPEYKKQKRYGSDDI